MHASGAIALTLRTSWVYARHGSNFLLDDADGSPRERDELRVVADQTGVPNWARAIAGATATLIAARRAPASADHAGLYHLSASGRTTWYDFARAIVADTRRARDADHDGGIPDAGAAAGVRRARCIAVCTHIRVCASRLANVVAGLPSIARGTADRFAGPLT